MNPTLPDDALEFGDTARKAFEKLGGVDCARRAEEDPDHRSTVADALAALGIAELDPRDDTDVLAAAAALCEAAGRTALPYPVVGAVLRQPDTGVPFALVPEQHVRVDHANLFAEWRVATLAGPTFRANWAPQESSGAGLGAQFGRLGPFVGELERGDELAGEAVTDASLWLALTSWQILGTVDRAVELACEHVSTRIQFGKPIATFQAVQFMLADAAVAVAGLRELASFTLWRVATAQPDSVPDVLALRVHALDTARAVLRTCQQLHGAAGVCDEYDISVLTRHVQPALRLPFGVERSTHELAQAIAADGFAGLFPHGGDHNR